MQRSLYSERALPLVEQPQFHDNRYTEGEQYASHGDALSSALTSGFPGPLLLRVPTPASSNMPGPHLAIRSWQGSASHTRPQQPTIDHIASILTVDEKLARLVRSTCC